MHELDAWIHGFWGTLTLNNSIQYLYCIKSLDKLFSSIQFTFKLINGFTIGMASILHYSCRCQHSPIQIRPSCCFYQVEAGPIFSRHWIPYLFFRTSPDIIRYSRCPDFSGHVRRPTQLPKLTRLLTSAISVPSSYMHVVANKLENNCHRSMSLCNRFDFGTSKYPSMFYLSNHAARNENAARGSDLNRTSVFIPTKATVVWFKSDPLGVLLLLRSEHSIVTCDWLTALVLLVKVQFRGPELFKKKGSLFQEELYLPGIFMLPWTSWRYDCEWMVSIWM